MELKAQEARPVWYQLQWKKAVADTWPETRAPNHQGEVCER